MKRIFLIGLIFQFQSAMAGPWTDQRPLRGVVKAFDKKCVTIQGADGKIFKIKREFFKDVQMVSGRTEIGYFTGSIELNKCN